MWPWMTICNRLVLLFFPADESEKCDSDDEDEEESYHYELIGVTVHTGTAEGGHYYSFIRDRLNKTETGHDKWLVTFHPNPVLTSTT